MWFSTSRVGGYEPTGKSIAELIERLRPLLQETSQKVYLLTRQSCGDVLVIHDRVVWMIIAEIDQRTPKHEFFVAEWADRLSARPATAHNFADEWGMKGWLIGRLRGLKQ
jgi:hypothetical protein